VLKLFAGGRLFGARHGSGTPDVLALPGWMRTHRDFDEVLDGLDAIALDLPGFGAAPPPPGAWTTAEYAGWVGAVLDEMATSVVVLGHSFGGRVAVHVAASSPATVAGLVLTGVPLVPDPNRPKRRPPVAFRLGRALHRRGVVSDRRMEDLRRRHGSSDYRAATGVMRGVLVRAVNESYADQLAALTCRVELVWGEDDDQAPLGVAEAAMAHTAQASLTRCPGGHFLPITAPGCLRQALDRQRSLLHP
jgi:pimeloyl-ACP methyl ester carboxylesterase